MDKLEAISQLSSIIRSAADTTSEGITISSMADNDQVLIYANTGFELLTGYSKTDVIGKNCRFLQGENTSEESVNTIRQAIKNGKGCTVELLNYKKNGAPFWNRLSITPLRDQDGKIQYYVGVQSDITELRETKRSLTQANQELLAFKADIQAELEQAKVVQEFILPAQLPISDDVKFSAFFKPVDEIGGDFYDIIKLNKGSFGILAADVTGHGIPAALLTFMTSYAFKNSVYANSSTAKVIESTNKKLYRKMPKGAFVTMFYAIYDPLNRKLTYSQAGHPEGLLVRPSKKVIIPLSSKGMFIGAVEQGIAHYGEEEVLLEKGDKVLIYSDAIAELRSGKTMIRQEDLYKFILDHCTEPLEELFQSIYRFGLDFTQKDKLDDDLTFVGFEVLK